VFSWLFYRSRYVPRLLAGLGIVAFVVIGLATLSKQILPPLADLAALSLVPGILFEIAIGLWLLVKGVELRGATSLPAA
jgi:hypothetical protein